MRCNRRWSTCNKLIPTQHHHQHFLLVPLFFLIITSQVSEENYFFSWPRWLLSYERGIRSPRAHYTRDIYAGSTMAWVPQINTDDRQLTMFQPCRKIFSDVIRFLQLQKSYIPQKRYHNSAPKDQSESKGLWSTKNGARKRSNCHKSIEAPRRVSHHGGNFNIQIAQGVREHQELRGKIASLQQKGTMSLSYIPRACYTHARSGAYRQCTPRHMTPTST